MDATSSMTRFGIVTPVYNAEEWICQNIQTVKYQSNQDFLHLIINDASTDDTAKIVEKNKHSKLVLLNTLKRVGAAKNHWDALQCLKDRVDVIINLDGDDWFLHSNVLAMIEYVYKTNEFLMATYGDYLATDPTFPSICSEPKSQVIRENIRLGWPFSHLRTFKAKLIQFLEEEDFKDNNGEWFSSAADVALFTPILELAGLDRVGKIKAPMIQYNRYTTINDDKVMLNEQVRCALEIANRKPKERCLVF